MKNMSQEQAAPVDGAESETVELPLSACPGCKPGDTIQFKVVSVDQNGGVINAMPVNETPDETANQGGGSDDLAQEVGETGAGEQ